MQANTGVVQSIQAQRKEQMRRENGARARQDGRRREEAWKRDIPYRYARYTLLGHPDAHSRGIVQCWLNTEPWNSEIGANLYITGPVGTGKTGLAIGALREAHFTGVEVHYTNVPDILTTMAGVPWSEKHRQMSRYHDVPLLLIDDLGAEHISDWSASMVYEVVEGRYRNGAPTIITTNLDKKTLRVAVGERVVSRLLDGAVEIGLGGDDRRKSAGPSGQG